jgi:hypothetical protein
MAGKKGMHRLRLAQESVGEAYREKLRAKINAGMLTKALIDHVVNGKEMTTTQVTAAMGLLRKVLPDLNSTEVQANVTTFTEYLDRIAALDTHAPEPSNKGETIQ